MKKGQEEERLLFTVGVIVICLIAIVFVFRMVFPSAESSREGQAKVVANMIAISANTLFTMDAGRVQKDFGLREPLLVEVNSRGGVSYVKVTYDMNGSKSYEVPLLVNVEPLAPTRVNMVYVMKYQGGKITVKGDLIRTDLTSSQDVACTIDTPKEKVIEYVNNAVSNPQVNKYKNIEPALVKSVINAESSGFQCKNGYIVKNKESGATGLMQIMPDTGNWINDYFGFKPYLDEKNPEDNVKLGSAYLSYLLNKYGNDKDKALAAYNWGPGNVDKFWPSIPKETRDYISKVTACYATCDLKTCALC